MNAEFDVCKCGRDFISVSGVCRFCVAEGALIFRAFTDGLIPLAEYLEMVARPGLLPVPAASLVLDPETGKPVTCGMRKDLFKAQRRHIRVDLGTDIQNQGVRGLVEVPVTACARCGRDLR